MPLTLIIILRTIIDQNFIEKNMKVRTRFAPSPTGSLHVGGARTALFNWLFARKHHGTFILRIEDTDVARSTHESAQGIIESMKWLGLDWDEGPFFQSDRLQIYKDHLDKLKKESFIYPAFESKEELEAMRAKAVAEKRNPIYDRASLKLSQQEVDAKINSGAEFVWRFKVPDEGYTPVPELLMADADYRLQNNTIGDFVITRPGTKEHPGMPLYNFVCTVDDALMNITHVIRGVEHLPNTVKQVLLYQALGYAPPQFVHLPLIMKNGKKMSKRDADPQGRFPVSVLERRDLGYLPEATLNHLALMGWSSPDGEEIFSQEKLIKDFDLNRLSKANANFDEDKYLFLNSHYLKELSDEALAALVKPYLTKAGFDLNLFEPHKLTQLIALEKTRCKIVSEFPEALAYFFEPPMQYDEKGVAKFITHNENAPKILQASIHMLETLHSFELESIHHGLHQIIDHLGLSLGKVGPIIRLALTGRTNSPSIGDIIFALGKTEVIKRLKRFVEHFV